MLRGYNDFESKFPELAKEWSPKNEPLRSSMITVATHRKVIWQCKLGHEWTASVKSRTVNGTGCPYCSHNFVLPGFNDLASRFPEIAAEWSERNLPLTPDQVTAFKNIKVWWKCRLGHEWNTLISTRAGGSQCPYCSGIKLLKGFNDLQTKFPLLATEWSEKNLPLTPDAVNEKSTKNIWWKCSTCGYGFILDFSLIIFEPVLQTPAVCAVHRHSRPFFFRHSLHPAISYEPSRQ